MFYLSGCDWESDWDSSEEESDTGTETAESQEVKPDTGGGTPGPSSLQVYDPL